MSVSVCVRVSVSESESGCEWECESEQVGESEGECEVLRLPRNLRIEGHRVLPRNLQTSHMSKSHDSLHLSRNLSSSTITTMSKVLHLPRKLHFEVKKSTLEHQKHEVSLAPATKSDHQIPKCARHHNESAVARSTRRGHPDSASLRSRNALRGFREA